MKKTIFATVIIFIIAVTVLIVSCSDSNNKTSADVTKVDEVNTEDIIKKGEHLVAIMGCNHCHSPKKMGATGPELIADQMLSGYPAERPVEKFDRKLTSEGFAIFYPDLTAAAGPWGISFAANLTPDETGIGNWSEEQFKKAITEGKSKGLDGSRPLLPPMPRFSELTADEIHCIYSYLKSLKPRKNIVPNPVTPDKM